MGQSQEQWIPLMDYAMKKGVSLSTLRRQIKSNKVPFKLENGRYLLLDGGEQAATAPQAAPVQRDVVALVAPKPAPAASPDAQQTIARLSHELKKAHEEIAELKTLIAFYEESMFKSRLDV